MSFLEPSLSEQRAVLGAVVDRSVAHAGSVGDIGVSPTLDAAELRSRLNRLDAEVAMEATAAIDWVADLLDGSMVHTTSPRYFGLFNPVTVVHGRGR